MEEAIRPLTAGDLPPADAGPAATAAPSGRTRAISDVVLNSVVSIAVSLFVMWVIRRAGLVFTPAALGLYLLSRRLADAGANLLQLGAPFTLRRYVSMSAEPSSQALYIATGIGVLGVASAVFLLGLVAWLDRWTSLAFEPGQGSRELMIWIGVLTIGQAFNNVAVSILIAFRRVIAFNLVAFVNAVVWPLAALALAGRGMEAVLRGLAAGTLAFSSIVAISLLALVARHAGGVIPWSRWKETLREFAGYGLPRTASPFVEVGLFLLGPWLIREDMAAAGYVILALMLLRVGQGLMQPAGYVLAAVAARLVGQKDEVSLRTGLNLLTGTLLYSGGLAFALAYPWTGVLLRLWLGEGPLSAAVLPYASAMVLSLLPFAVFQGLKELIEMVWTAPRNLYTLLVSISVLVVAFLAAHAFLPRPQSVLVGYVVAFWVAGLMTLWWIRRYLNPAGYFGMARWAAVLMGIALVNGWAARAWSAASLVEAATAAGLAILGSGLLGAGLLCLVSPPPFVREAAAFLWPGRASAPVRG